MENLYNDALRNMESTVHRLAKRVPQPIRLPFKDSFVFRHTEKTIHQAIVQKLARTVSTLHAAKLLMQHGFVQEQAALQRMLDEIQEDITFLTFGIIFDNRTLLHQEYLNAFFEEEFDADSALVSTQKRPMIKREKIRAYIARTEGAGVDPSTGTEVSRTISKTYSGYVHAASPQIMDMYGGNPAKFHMQGMLNTQLHDDHKSDLWNYFYRGIISFSFAAKAFGDEKLFHEIYQFTKDFAQLSGKDYKPT
ncbi:hypothetical protein [Methylotenera sp. N17]|uniref:hypothetical protein n=1 Tax=Methylotenera sp. N17 TaxID=1502761 RepID=UPI000A9C2F74|nr:hypothetical protein [Methylotenera sp. N17]